MLFSDFLKLKYLFKKNLKKHCECHVLLWPAGCDACRPQSMAAPAHSSRMWMLIVGACVSLVAGSDCGKECALCVYRLLGQQSGFSSLVMWLYYYNAYLYFWHTSRQTDTWSGAVSGQSGVSCLLHFILNKLSFISVGLRHSSLVSPPHKVILVQFYQV